MAQSPFYAALKPTKEVKSHLYVETYGLKRISSLKTKFTLNNVPLSWDINFNLKYVIILRFLLYVFTLIDDVSEECMALIIAL